MWAAAAAVAVVALPAVVAEAQASGLSVEVSAPSVVETGDNAVHTFTVTNSTSAIQQVTITVTGSPVGDGQAAAYRHIDAGLPFGGCVDTCTFGVGAGQSRQVLVSQGAATAGTISSSLEATADGLDAASVETSSQVQGPACDVVGGHLGDDLRAPDAGGRVCGFAGIDTLIPGPGPDVLIGGVDGARLDLRSARVAAGDGSRGYEVDLRQVLGTSRLIGAAGSTDQVRDVWMVTGSNNADRITGTPGVNVIDGGAGNDRLDGAGGNDTMVGGRGNDILIGGAGEDKVAYYVHGSAVRVSLATNRPQGTGGAGVDTISTTVENLDGTRYDDLLIGDGGGNGMSGGLGNDRIFGGGGDDWINGGPGDDSFDAGPGYDMCKQGPGRGPTSNCERHG